MKILNVMLGIPPLEIKIDSLLDTDMEWINTSTRSRNYPTFCSLTDIAWFMAGKELFETGIEELRNSSFSQEQAALICEKMRPFVREAFYSRYNWKKSTANEITRSPYRLAAREFVDLFNSKNFRCGNIYERPDYPLVKIEKNL